MTLQEFNSLSKKEAFENLFRCCGSTHWANEVMENFPFTSVEELKSISDQIWMQCDKKDWLEAFSHHPKIGERPGQKHESTATWAGDEQSGMKAADEKTKSELALLNAEYEETFGYIYLICATGKTSEELLSILKVRINNEASIELQISATEQNKITHLRIDKLFS
jgi:2-oxo-4-hydroxy-4-carboxy-5-ureidoimidazoline decarboxylase